MDIAVVAILCFFTYVGYKNGLIKTLLKLVIRLAALMLTYIFNPVFSKLIRQTGFYNFLKHNISKSIGLNDAMGQSNFINNLNLPGFLKTSLLANNNSEVHNILDVSGIEDYVSGFLANICINIISLIVLYIIVVITLRVLIEIIDTTTKLPVIKQLNGLGGGIIGLCLGIFSLWMIFVVITFFIALPSFNYLYTAINDSTLTLVLYKSNLLMSMILKLFA